MLAVAVLKDADVGAFRDGVTELFGELNWAVMRVVVGYKAANESDEDIRSR